MKFSFFSRFLKMDTSAKTVKNLPDLVRKINKNEIQKYQQISLEEVEIKKKDTLYMRITKPEFDYIEEINKETTLRKRIKLNIKYLLAKYLNVIPNKINFRQDKIINRPNEHLRIPHFNLPNFNYKNPESNFKNKKYTMFTVFFVFLFGVYFSCLIGYFYSRLKYDIYYRKYMYCYYSSVMLLFEWIDYHATSALEYLEYYFPKYISDKEAEYIAFRKMQVFFKRRKINKSVNMILETDPDLLEIDEMLKKINK